LKRFILCHTTVAQLDNSCRLQPTSFWIHNHFRSVPLALRVALQLASCPYATFFFYLHSGGWSPNWVHSARRPLTGLLYLPRVIVRMENLVE
jgi:hypothetical protein